MALERGLGLELLWVEMSECEWLCVALNVLDNSSQMIKGQVTFTTHFTVAAKVLLTAVFPVPPAE